MKVAILGYGKSGKAAEKLLKLKNISLIDIFDDKIEGFRDIKEIDCDYDLFVVSPGIDLKKIDLPKSKITSELELAMENIKDKKILGITGTNGKSTITFLTSQILNNAGFKASYCGNIGKTLGDTYLEENPDIYVLEMSSFQIDLLNKFNLYSACISNITPDHLDRYGSMEDYIFSKKRIADFVEGKLFIEENEWNKYFTSCKNLVYIDPDLKKYPVFENSMLKFSDFYLDISKFKLFGFHNIVNLAFSMLLANEVADFKGDVTDYIENLQALEHRCEFTVEIDGVRYINDSKGTNVDSTLTALKSSEYPTTLLLGGKDKNGDFTILSDEINKKVTNVICFGAAGEKIFSMLRDRISCNIEKVPTLRDAIDRSMEITKIGTVLFSPACASFDEFNNFEERGRFFKSYLLSKRV
ncbi:MAG: UDP-N-acetylmuramoyl-L-alanine--D-glutamate ligase [Calditerrivibrio sp.]|nr:UDP-N-acetylmuramoyl-L-alanine--D-glutamate ligase [Calditerrivibrio sp.]MCA1980711.1 UDP-N-acetylmuramoyl-L-alanine--D-glutamate ligase [Calditerrivibrio sp.]